MVFVISPEKIRKIQTTISAGSGHQQVGNWEIRAEGKMMIYGK